MLAPLLSLSLCLLACPQGQESGPDASAVARVESALDEAYRSGELERIRTALEAGRTVPHPSVVRAVLRGLEDEREEVKLTVLQTLRWLEHPDALEALQRLTKDKKLMRAPDLALAVLRGIGQHAQPASVAVLARDPFEPDLAWCVRARIFGLARIRTPEALQALFGILAITAPGGQRRVQGQAMKDMRLGLMILTGVDRGFSPELWEDWWRENRKSFELPPQAPLLPRELRVDWDAFWGLPRVYEREQRREDRGKDPPPRKE